MRGTHRPKGGGGNGFLSRVSVVIRSGFLLPLERATARIIAHAAPAFNTPPEIFGTPAPDGAPPMPSPDGTPDRQQDGRATVATSPETGRQRPAVPLARAGRVRACPDLPAPPVAVPVACGRGNRSRQSIRQPCALWPDGLPCPVSVTISPPSPERHAVPLARAGRVRACPDLPAPPVPRSRGLWPWQPFAAIYPATVPRALWP